MRCIRDAGAVRNVGAPEVGPGGLALAAIAPWIVGARDRRRATPSCSWPDTHYHDDNGDN